MSRSQYSVVEYHSAQEGNRCGYCRSPNTSCSHGMSAQLLTVQHYQSLIDRGWRRSGSYCYKPMMKQTCCPHYTIKCEALNFKLSKSQKKIFKRMLKFLRNELQKDEAKSSPIKSDEDIVRCMEIPGYSKYADRAEKNAAKMQVTSVSEELSERFGASVSNSISSTSTKEQSRENVSSTIQLMETTTTSKELKQFNFDPTRAPQRKAKLIRIERKRNKLLAQGKTPEEINTLMRKNKTQNSGKTLEEYFEEIRDCSNKLELKLVRTSPISDNYKNTAKESFELYKKYQMIIHGDKLSKLSEDRYTRFLVRSPLRMKLVKVKSEEFLNTFDQSARLFKKYQMAIHKDQPKDCDKKAFFDFLARSPLQEWKPDNNSPPEGYGSFHEQYWLNGTLIAVAVIDILPLCVSSVYFFYDPEYSYLCLGTFSSLREVYLTRQLHKSAPNLKYYYMGYYIHSCTKMRYKARMRPSKLLCPETYVWCDIDKCLPKLNVSKYSRLNEDSSARDENSEVDIQQVLILNRSKAMVYAIFRIYLQSDIHDAEIKEYASLVGKNCAVSMLYYIDD